MRTKQMKAGISAKIWYNQKHIQPGDWRSWLARAVWDREVEGSSPLSPTNQRVHILVGFLIG